MAKRTKMTKRQVTEAWKGLTKADRRFLSAAIVINQAVGDEKLRYHELPARIERLLRRSDRNTLFSIITECLGLLTKAPAMDRVRAVHRQRNALRGQRQALRTTPRSKSGRR